MICRLKAMSLLVYFLFHSYIIYKQINKQGIMVNVNVFYQLSSMRPNSNNVSSVGCWWMHGKIKKHVHCNSYAFSKWDLKKWKWMRSCSEALTSCGRNEVLFDLKNKSQSFIKISLVWDNKTSFNLCNVFCFGCHILCSDF